MPHRSLKLLERQPVLVEQVYNALRLQLRSGEMQAGQPMQEVRLAEQLGVSRTPVREALARLASEGLLATDRAFAADLLALRPHPGQAVSATNLRTLLAGSPIVASHRIRRAGAHSSIAARRRMSQ